MPTDWISCADTSACLSALTCAIPDCTQTWRVWRIYFIEIVGEALSRVCETIPVCPLARSSNVHIVPDQYSGQIRVVGYRFSMVLRAVIDI